jgi:hypothetical protein
MARPAAVQGRILFYIVTASVLKESRSAVQGNKLFYIAIEKIIQMREISILTLTNKITYPTTTNLKF